MIIINSKHIDAYLEDHTILRSDSTDFDPTPSTILGRIPILITVVPGYVEMVKQTNQGSIAVCAWKLEDSIERPLTSTNIFISFGAVIRGLVKGCRGRIRIDGAHLKGQYGGTLLSAVALDGNNQLFPNTWAIDSGDDQET